MVSILLSFYSCLIYLFLNIVFLYIVLILIVFDEVGGQCQGIKTLTLTLTSSVSTKIENGPKTNTRILRFLKMKTNMKNLIKKICSFTSVKKLDNKQKYECVLLLKKGNATFWHCILYLLQQIT